MARHFALPKLSALLQSFCQGFSLLSSSPTAHPPIFSLPFAALSRELSTLDSVHLLSGDLSSERRSRSRRRPARSLMTSLVALFCLVALGTATGVGGAGRSGPAGGLSIVRSNLDARLIEVARARALAAEVSAATAVETNVVVGSSDDALVAVLLSEPTDGVVQVSTGGNLVSMPLAAPSAGNSSPKGSAVFARRLLIEKPLGSQVATIDPGVSSSSRVEAVEPLAHALRSDNNGGNAVGVQ